MTREESIAKINRLRNEYNDQYIDYCGVNEAVNMAIEALKAEPVRHGRWEAVDWANEYFKCSECGRIERWSPNYCATCGSKMATRTLYVRGTPNIIEEPNGVAKKDEE